MVFQHITEFLDIVNTDSNIDVGLGYFSEQAFESLHSDMKVGQFCNILWKYIL